MPTRTVNNELVEQILIDESTANTTYFGYSSPGVLTSEALWKIKRMTVSSGVTTFQWCDGDNNYDNVWDDRASLVYE